MAGGLMQLVAFGMQDIYLRTNRRQKIVHFTIEFLEEEILEEEESMYILFNFI
jgi:hypothetical protein